MVDIGAKVKAGDLLATISAPEVDAQLRQTEADLLTAQANYNIAHTTAVRWRNLFKTDPFPKQEMSKKIALNNVPRRPSFLRVLIAIV